MWHTVVPAAGPAAGRANLRRRWFHWTLFPGLQGSAAAVEPRRWIQSVIVHEIWRSPWHRRGVLASGCASEVRWALRPHCAERRETVRRVWRLLFRAAADALEAFRAL